MLTSEPKFTSPVNMNVFRIPIEVARIPPRERSDRRAQDLPRLKGADNGGNLFFRGQLGHQSHSNICETAEDSEKILSKNRSTTL